MGPTKEGRFHSPLSSLSPTFLAPCSPQNREGDPLPPRARSGADELCSPDCTGVDDSGCDGA